MNFYYNLKTGTKLLIGFLIMGIILIIVSAISYSNIAGIANDLNLFKVNNFEPVDYIGKMTAGFLVVRGDAYKYVTMPEQRPAIRQEITQNIANVDEQLALLKANGLDEDCGPKLVVFDEAWKVYRVEIVHILDLVDKRDDQTALASLRDGTAHTSRKAAQDAMDFIRTELSDEASTVTQEAIQNAQWVNMIVGISVIIGVSLGLVAALLISRTITGPLKKVMDVAQGVADGKLDLSTKVALDTRDEVGVLASIFNRMTDRLEETLRKEQEQHHYLQMAVEQYVDFTGEVAQGNLARRLTLNTNGHAADDPMYILGERLNDMVASLQTMIIQVREAVNNLSTTATEILAATTQQASGASEQSAAISQTTTTVEEVKTISAQVVERSREVANSSQRTVEVSLSGQSAVGETISSMSLIKDKVEGIAENIMTLQEKTQQIGEIISTINDIASQSNLLALNASIEGGASR